MKCKGVSAKLAISGKIVKSQIWEKRLWAETAHGLTVQKERGGSPMGLGPVGGEGHRQAGLRLGHEEETGGGRSRPRVLRWPTRS